MWDWINILSEVHEISFCPEYAEPGYHNEGGEGILFSNWNEFDDKVVSVLEQLGYSCEWFDEWIIDHDSNVCYRTSPTSYDWQPSYAILDDGSIFGSHNLNDEFLRLEYIESLINSPTKGNTFGANKLKLGYHGFEKVNRGSFESGLHEGMNDDPRVILNHLLKNDPEGEFIFDLSEASQFYITFDVYKRSLDS